MNMMYYILHINTSNISNSKNFVSLQTNGSCLCLPTCSLSHAPSCTFFFKLVSYFIYSFFEGNALHFFFLFYFILLYNTILVLPYIDMNQPRVYMSSQSWKGFIRMSEKFGTSFEINIFLVQFRISLE